MSWDEAFALHYDEWSAHMEADIAGLHVEALYGGFAGEPFTDDSREYVFVANLDGRRPIDPSLSSADTA